MFFHSRLTRQRSPDSPSQQNNTTTPANNNDNNSPTSAPSDPRADASQPSSASQPRVSRDSEGYPSWLPKRPPPPVPASAMHSSTHMTEPEPDTDPEVFASIGGRRQTPRSVRIVSLHGIRPFAGGRSKGKQREKSTADHSRQGRIPRAWSRATAPVALSPGGETSGYPYYNSTRQPQPKFNAKGLHIELLRNPSILARIYFYIFPVLALAHLPLQTFFDFNAVYMLIQVSRYPNPEAPGVPGSGRNWALGAAAYIACWLAWILVVFLLYELIYSFIRRWRIKRPTIMPIYLSTPAYTFVSMTSYVNFSFLLQLRMDAFIGEHGSLRDGLAETFYWYSQNLPTVALLLPRAGLCLALLFAFSSPQPGMLSLASMGISNRDATFFRRDTGTLTNYARGVLIANAVWAAWRILVLLMSWIGLWLLSGQGCAGLCGPRYRWEEEEAEKMRSSIYGTETDSNKHIDALAWAWKECTRLRIQETYEFCLTTKPSLRWGSSAPPPPGTAEGVLDEKGKIIPEPDPIEVQRVLAAAGFPVVPPLARRKVLTEDLFSTPTEEKEIELRHRESDKGVGPSRSATLAPATYPFNQPGSGQVSSQDKIPFPPSPRKSRTSAPGSDSSHSSSSDTTASSDNSGSTENDVNEEEEEEEDGFDESEQPSTGHASNSMSSLGHPISLPQRYPFSFRQPGGMRGGNTNSASSRSHQSRPSQSGVSGVSYSGISQSTGNVDTSTDSHEAATSSSSSGRPRASLSQSSGGSPVIPMPPRHPNPHARTRPPSMPLPPLPAEPPVAFPSIRIRADSGMIPGVTVGAELMHDDAASMHTTTSSEDGSGEGQDSVGLLSPRTSHTNLGVPRRAESSSSRSRTGSARSRANSSRSGHSGVRERVSSLGVVVRSRAQSLLQNVSATSLDLVRGGNGNRSRTNSSMARLEEEATHQLPELPSRLREVSGNSNSTDETRETHVSRPSFASTQAWEERDYLSSSSHSRSGSGSGSGGENWTFGVPMPFIRPGRSHLREEVLTDSDLEGREDSRRLRAGPERDDVLRDITEDFGPVRGQRQQPNEPSSPPTFGFGGVARSGGSPSGTSAAEDVFLSAEASTRTASPLPPATLTPHSYEHQREHEQETEISRSPNIDIPWGPYRLHDPYTMHDRSLAQGRHSAGSLSTHQQQSPHTDGSTSTSPPVISTAAQSFVTAPATIEGGSTTEGSGEPTERGSLHESAWDVTTARGMRGAGIGNVGLGTGVGPERADSMGDWRVR